jgi:hypothetical protein
MDDLMSKISQILSDPESMRQITELASAVGGGADSDKSEGKSADGGAPDISALLSSLIPKPDAGNEPAAPQKSAPDIAKLARIGTEISSSLANDRNIAFLNALKPLLKEETRPKIDRLVKIFGIMAAYPLIRDSGLLGGDLFG